MKEAITHGDLRFPIQAYTVPFDLPNHWHNEFEFLYMNRGSATYWVDTQPFDLAEGECGFASKGQMHSIDYHDESNSDSPRSCLIRFFSRESSTPAVSISRASQTSGF
jgi:hypothetical protein